MRVLILHDELPPGARPDELDVLAQVDAIDGVLRAAGHRVSRRPVGLRFDVAARAIRDLTPDVVVNLVESIDRSGRLVHLATSLLDHLRVPFTGCSTAALFDTSDKVRAKERLVEAGIPTPEWATASTAIHLSDVARHRFIVKSRWEHGSLGLDDEAVVQVADGHALRDVIAARTASLGGAAFAERYVHGREFNVALLEVDGAPVVLPLAEIRFEGYAAGRPRVVGYRAKWDTDSDAYRDTPRSFDVGDDGLGDRLSDIARACWDLFELDGYARVDLRVDERGEPFVLEVNANPCLAPDAGFAAAAERSGRSYGDVIDALLGAARTRTPS